MTSVTPFSKRVRGERGAAILEVALTLPLVLLVSVGIFEFGRAFQTWQILTNAAREGARVAMLPGDDDGMAEQRVRAYMEAGQLLDFDTVGVVVNPGGTIDLGGGTASASIVTVTYPFNFIVLNPIARLVVGGSELGAAPITITASAAMRNESPF
jgi:Flp pilus assembly protein TadG